MELVPYKYSGNGSIYIKMKGSHYYAKLNSYKSYTRQINSSEKC